MMRFSYASCLLISLQAAVAVAQTSTAAAPDSSAKPARPIAPAAAAPASEAGGVQQVEVVAERQTNRIDRQVYDVKSDISTSNASAAEALNNVPSVQVDPDGSVRLRGNQNVTILLDGKPSAMLQGDNRGAVLNAMPADFIETIEVINNPGAEFGNEGGGGPILNLISRRNRRPGGFGAVTGNYGTAGRYNGGVNGSYAEGFGSVDSFLNYRHDGRGSTTNVFRERIDPLTGLVSTGTQEGRSNGLNGNLNFITNFRYNVGKADRMGASVGYQQGGRDSTSLTHYLDYAPDGRLVSDNWRSAVGKGESHNYSGGMFYEHKLDEDGATLKFDLRVSSSQNPSDSSARRTYVQSIYPRPDELSSQHRAPAIRINDFTTDYSGKLGEGFMLSGVKLVDTAQDFNTRYTITDPVTGVERENTILTNAFRVDQRVLAAYGTYEYRFNPQWSIKSGARVERTEQDLHQLTSNINVRNEYTNVLPSAFLSYRLSSDTTIRLSYSRRLMRPNANDLNPYVIYVSPTDRSSGNPNLRPVESDSYEIGYDTTWAGVKTDLRLFARNEDDVITPRQVVIKDEAGQDVVLTTRQNFGSVKSQGLEFVFNGRPMTGLTLNFAGNLRHATQTQFAGIGQPSTLSNTSLSGRGRMNYQITAGDQIQFMLMGQGRQLWGQGFREPNWTANLTWQHKLTPLLTLTANVTDLFNTNRNASHTNTDFLRQTSSTVYDGRIVYVGFRYQLGGVTGMGTREGGGRGEGMRGGGAGMMPGGPSPM